MKRVLAATAFWLTMASHFLNAQAPANYYNSAAGLSGTALQSALHNIIDNHTVVSYAGLWTAYQTTDRKPNEKVWDMYSDKPGFTPPYEYTMGSDQCGNGSNHENSCYNREHTWPQSYFNGASPMVSDLWLVYPTDYYVNNQRANFAYGQVSNPTKTFLNGARLGSNTFPGAPANTCYEPIDSFKGDIARTYFYIATRYFGEDSNWDTWEMANKAVLNPWAVQMLLSWHQLDPVSRKEVNRNNAVYALQNNRNPFIDSPQYVQCIWGAPGTCRTPTAVSSISLGSPALTAACDPVARSITFNGGPEKAVMLEILDLQGRVLERIVRSGKQWVFRGAAYPGGLYLARVQGTEGVSVIRIALP